MERRIITLEARGQGPRIERRADGTVERYGKLNPTSIGKGWDNYIWGNGGDVLDTLWNYMDPTECLIDSPECIEATQHMVDPTYKHKVTPTPAEAQEARLASDDPQAARVQRRDVRCVGSIADHRPHLLAHLGRRVPGERHAHNALRRRLQPADGLHRVALEGGRQAPDYFCRSYRRFFSYADARLRSLRGSLLSRLRYRQQLEQIEAQKRPRPGRNDPCPCGSGRKHKACCGDPALSQSYVFRQARL